MPVDVLMPALSPTMEKGNLSKWMKSEGDKVKAGDVIAEIETDKATMEVEAVDEGILAKIMVPEGSEHVAVNTPIALIAGEGENAAEIGKADAAPAAAKAAPPQAVPEAPAARRRDRPSATPLVSLTGKPGALRARNKIT